LAKIRRLEYVTDTSHGGKTGDAQIGSPRVVRIKSDACSLRRGAIKGKVSGHVIPSGAGVEVGLRGVEELKRSHVALRRECPGYPVVRGRKLQILKGTSLGCAPTSEVLRTLLCDG